MRTMILILSVAMTACAIEPRTSVNAQDLYIETVCDPISGECHEEVTGTLNGGGSTFNCTYSDSRPECGTYLNYMSAGTGSANSYLALDTMEAALFDPFFLENGGYTMTCGVTLDANVDNAGVAQCTLTQGPRHWACTVFKGESSSFCCRGSVCN